jgi:hypothetical protein
VPSGLSGRCISNPLSLIGSRAQIDLSSDARKAVLVMLSEFFNGCKATKARKLDLFLEAIDHCMARKPASQPDLVIHIRRLL